MNRILDTLIMGGVCAMWLMSAGGAVFWYAVHWPYLLKGMSNERS